LSTNDVLLEKLNSIAERLTKIETKYDEVENKVNEIDKTTTITTRELAIHIKKHQINWSTFIAPLILALIIKSDNIIKFIIQIFSGGAP